MIIGSLSLTGVAHSFSTEIISLAGGNLVLLLVLGAVTSFILGMGMTITACYVFLALILAPALVKSGLDPLAVHLYIMYWGMASYITPPVALSAFVAAGLAGADPMRTGFKAMQLGFVKYFVPFYFVINPAIILQGQLPEILLSVTLITITVIAMSYSLEGYMPLLGQLPVWLRGNLFLCGLCLGFPWPAPRVFGLLLLVCALLSCFLIWKARRRLAIPAEG
jgi:TRAP-type uncharacterized transport system fused permease subunit